MRPGFALNTHHERDGEWTSEFASLSERRREAGRLTKWKQNNQKGLLKTSGTMTEVKIANTKAQSSDPGYKGVCEGMKEL